MPEQKGPKVEVGRLSEKETRELGERNAQRRRAYGAMNKAFDRNRRELDAKRKAVTRKATRD